MKLGVFRESAEKQKARRIHQRRRPTILVSRIFKDASQSDEDLHKSEAVVLEAPVPRSEPTGTDDSSACSPASSSSPSSDECGRAPAGNADVLGSMPKKRVAALLRTATSCASSAGVSGANSASSHSTDKTCHAHQVAAFCATALSSMTYVNHLPPILSPRLGCASVCLASSWSGSWRICETLWQNNGTCCSRGNRRSRS